MAKKPAEGEGKLVKVKLVCTYSGFGGAGESPGPGTIVEVDEAEAQRLIDVGGAVAATEEPEAPAQ